MEETQNNSAYIAAPNKKTAREYSLLLDSLSIPNNAVFRWNSWHIEVDLSDYEKAKNEIASYEKSGRIEKIHNKFAHIRFQKVDWIQLVMTLVLLAAFHVFIYEFDHLELIKAGRSIAIAITEGEFFRAVTALTLHGDYKHLFSNIFFGGIVLWALSTMTGTGIALLFALFTGFAGNVMNAFFYGSAHNSIGASTSVFGVIGVLVTATNACTIACFSPDGKRTGALDDQRIVFAGIVFVARHIDARIILIESLHGIRRAIGQYNGSIA